MSRFHQASCGFFPHFSDSNPCWYCTVLVPRLSGVQLQATQKQKQWSFSNQPHQIPKRWHQYPTSPEICETEIVYNEVECAKSKYAIVLLYFFFYFFIFHNLFAMTQYLQYLQYKYEYYTVWATYSTNSIYILSLIHI